MTDCLKIPDEMPLASFQESMRAIKSAADKKPFVLQIGAMDGVEFDFFRPLLIEGGWKALLVEPLPDMFEKLQQTYADLPQIRFANRAIAEHNGVIKMRRVDPSAVASGLVVKEAVGFASIYTDRGLLKDAISDNALVAAAQRHVLEVEVPCCTLDELLSEYQVDAIDVVLIDTEGADWMIARQLDLNRYHPQLVCLEYNSLTGPEVYACCSHFLQNGYTFALCKEDVNNFLFFPKPRITT